MEKRKLIQFKEKYQNKWVAIGQKSGRVLGFGRDLRKLSHELGSVSEDYLLEKVTPLAKAFAPFSASS